MTPNTQALTTALRLVADSLEEGEDSDLIKATIFEAAERLEKLEQERDALAAHVEQLRIAALNAVQLMSGGKAKADLRDAYDATSAQHLAEIKAQAIEGYANKLQDSGRGVTIRSVKASLLSYANKIRSEAAE